MSTDLDLRDWRRRARRLAVVLILCVLSTQVRAQTPITLFRNFVGHVNYQATGGSLRNAPNTANACSLSASSSAAISGVPSGATIRAAYLYWAGSGSTADNAVSFNGSTVAASRTFRDTYSLSGTDYDFFSGFSDVTSRVTGNGTYTFSGLNVANGAPYCAVQAVVAGWSLVVVYEHAAEDLRAVNVFDGFQLFRSNSLALNVDTFRIPAAPVNGKVTHISWEGDPQNSGPLGGVSESLSFNGSLLDDGLVPPGSSPTVQQFDGTVNTLGSMTTHGVDVDTYDVSALLSPGDTSASTTYSSGSDLVLLSAEVISFTTEPIVDLSATLSHSGSFAAGSNGQYSIRIANGGPEDEVNPIVVGDSLPAGLGFVSGTGPGWSCAAVAQDVTCTHPGPLAVGASLPDLTLSVAVTSVAAPAVTNTAVVSSNSIDAVPSNNAGSDETTVLASDLSASTKTVVDLDGGDADPGDVLRYTITLEDTGGLAAGNVNVTDDMPAHTSGFTIVSLPPGSTDASTGGGTGANATGRLDIANVFVPAYGSVAIVFDVTVAGNAMPGDVISNEAQIANPDGIGASPLAPDVVVAQSSISVSGTKTLYLFDEATSDPNGFNAGPQPYLSRTPPAGFQNEVEIPKSLPARSWTMSPALQAPLTIGAGSVPVTLLLSKTNNGANTLQRTVRVELGTTGAVTGPLGTAVTQTFAAPQMSSPLELTFAIPLAATTTLPPGTQMVLTVTNVTPGGGQRSLFVWPTFAAARSRIDFTALTVVNVDAAGSYDAAFPAGAAQTSFAPGSNVSLRADVSDPFGAFDIASVTVDILDGTSSTVVAGQAMSQAQSLNGAAQRYEFLYTLPASANGTWTYRIRAVEGTEGIVSHERTGAFAVAALRLTLTKSVVVESDPANGGVNPKAIPGAVMVYTVNVSNSSATAVDDDSIRILDVLPPEAALFVDASAGDPIEFTDGTPSSGLTFDYATAVRYSSQPGGGAPFDYLPIPDAGGFDAAVTGIHINPQGVLSGANASGSPAFTLRYRARIE